MAQLQVVLSLTLVVFNGIFVSPELIDQRFNVVHSWKTLDFAWKNQQEKSDFIPRNNALIGIKLWKDFIFLSIPRQRAGIPVTLATIPKNSSEVSPKLEPYPNWEMQEIGNCDAFQFVQSMEVDTEDRLWVIDTGRIKMIFGENNSSVQCAPKIVVIDLITRTTLKTYIFPEEVASKASSNLNDLVVDSQNGYFAYISDSGGDPGIIVYSLASSRSWKLYDTSFPAGKQSFTVNGVLLSMPGNQTNGITLSPPGGQRTLYYSTLGDDHLHSVPTSVLQRRRRCTTDVTASVTDLGPKLSHSGGIVMDNSSTLYMSLMTLNAVGVWNTKSGSLEESQRVLAQNNDTLQWPDTFALDTEGYLWLVSNRLQNFMMGKEDPEVETYRILKTYLGKKSYLYL